MTSEIRSSKRREDTMKYTPDNTKNMICDINVPERDATKNNGALADVLYFSHLAPAANGAYFVPEPCIGQRLFRIARRTQ